MTAADGHHCRRLQPSELPALLRFLSAHRAASLILLSNARRAGLTDAGERFQGVYVASFDGRRITGVAAHYRSGMLALQAPEHAAELALLASSHSGYPLHGMLGPSDQVRAAASAGAGRAPVFDSPEILYTLELAGLPAATPGLPAQRARRATLADLDTLAGWAADYNIELLGARASDSLLRHCRSSVQRLIRGGHQWVLTGSPRTPAKPPAAGFGAPATGSTATPSRTVTVTAGDGDRLLAACTFNAGVDDCIQIGGVWTPAALRGRGYARRVIAGALRTAREEGITEAVLFTAINNQPARRVYTSLGFTPAGSYHIRLYRHPA